uniref:HIG1 domain-containing protein n=1 Tax=Panagrellus redivivus TaxID=6233 RepID=A0A7E4V917_PANRE
MAAIEKAALETFLFDLDFLEVAAVFPHFRPNSTLKSAPIMPQEGPRRYMTPKEYMEAHRARGGCADEFKQTMVKSGKLGVGVGIPFGFYVAYQNGHRTFKSFGSKVVFTTMSSTIFFGAIGLITATYSCLKVDGNEN